MLALDFPWRFAVAVHEPFGHRPRPEAGEDRRSEARKRGSANIWQEAASCGSALGEDNKG